MTTTGTHGGSSATREIELADRQSVRDHRRDRTVTQHCPRLSWLAGSSPRQHIDIRLTAEVGYRAQRSYSIATPADGEQVAITVELVDDGRSPRF